MASARGIIIEIIGDAKSYLRAAEQSIGATVKIGQSTSKLAANTIVANESISASNTAAASSYGQLVVDADLAAKARVMASIKSIDAMQAEAAALHRLSVASTESTRVREAAAVQATAADAQLARAQGLTVVGNRRLSSSSKEAERDLNKIVRGGLAGSGIFSKMGRSLAFASSGFIAFAVGAELITKSITNAEDFEKATNSLRVAIQHTGGDVAKLQPRYEATAKAAAQFGVTEITATQSLARATVLTGNASAAQRAYQEALVISKATGKDFNLVLTATSKAQEGITTSLRRYGILVSPTMTGTEQFALVMKRFGGQAEANTTSLERLRAEFSNALTTIGVQLLPAVNRLAEGFAKWLEKMNRSGQLQADVVKGMKAIKFVATPLIESIKELASAVGLLNDAWSKLGDLQKGGGITGLFAGIPSAGFDFLKSGVKSELFPIQNLKDAFSHPKPPPAPLVQPSRFFPTDVQFGRPPPTPRFSFAKPMKQFWKTFELNFKEQMSQAQAALTRSSRDDVAGAREVVARVKRLIDQGRLHGPALISALGLEAQALSTIWSAEDAIAQKRAAAAQKAKDRAAAAFANLVDPLGVEVELLRAEAAGRSTLPALKKLLASARRALSQAKNLAQQQAALQQIVAIQQQIKDATTQASVQFVASAKLQLALAKDAALGRDNTKDLLRLKAAILKFIRTHKHNTQALIDAYNQLAAVNEQLGSQASSALGLFKQASTKALTEGLGLTAEQRRQLRARLSQLGPGGTVPGEGVGAGGMAIDPETGRPISREQQRHRRQRRRDAARADGGTRDQTIVIHDDINVYLDGKQLESTVTRHQQRLGRRNPSQRRGPNAGTT